MVLCVLVHVNLTPGSPQLNRCQGTSAQTCGVGMPAVCMPRRVAGGALARGGGNANKPGHGGAKTIVAQHGDDKDEPGSKPSANVCKIYKNGPGNVSSHKTQPGGDTSRSDGDRCRLSVHGRLSRLSLTKEPLPAGPCPSEHATIAPMSIMRSKTKNKCIKFHVITTLKWVAYVNKLQQPWLRFKKKSKNKYVKYKQLRYLTHTDHTVNIKWAWLMGSTW